MPTAAPPCPSTGAWQAANQAIVTGSGTLRIGANYKVYLPDGATNPNFGQRYTGFNTVTTPTGEVVFNGNGYGLQAPRRFIFSTDVRF